MHRDPVTHSDPDRSDLAIFHPNAGKTRPWRGANTVNFQQSNEQILEPTQIAMEILSASAEVENWITNQLASYGA